MVRTVYDNTPHSRGQLRTKPPDGKHAGTMTGSALVALLYKGGNCNRGNLNCKSHMHYPTRQYLVLPSLVVSESVMARERPSNIAKLTT